MAEESILAPSGGMNSDDSSLNPNKGDGGISRFQAGDYRYALNARIGSSTQANVGALENIASTLEVSNYYYWDGAAWQVGTAPSGVNIARGRCEDISNGRVFWPVYNDGGDHTILMWVKKERRIYEILKWSGLNFNAQSQVSMCLINKYLTLVDGIATTSNPPRMVNVDEVYDTKFILGSNFSEYHISLAKWAPLQPPLPLLNEGATVNEVAGHGMYQFSYRYVFYNGFVTTWSPFSTWVTAESLPATLTKIDVSIIGFTFDYETPANTGYDNSSIKWYQVVQFVEVAYRQSQIDPWKMYKRVSINHAPLDPVTSYSFIDKSNISTIAQTDIDRYFDAVPFLSTACEAIDNRPMLGNNKDDIPAHSDFTVENVEVYSATQTAGSWLANGTTFPSLTGAQQVLFNHINWIRRYSFKEGGVYKLGIIYQTFSGRTGLVNSPDEWIYSIPSVSNFITAPEGLHALGFTIPGSVLPPVEAVAFQIVRTNCLNISFFITGFINNYKFLQFDTSGVTDDVNTPDSIRSVINDYYNSSGPVASIPLSKRILAVTRKSTVVTSGGVTNAGLIYIDISNWSLSSRAAASPSTQANPSNNLFYNYLEGDKVRFWGSTTTANPVTSADLDKRFDCEIIDWTGNGAIVKKPDDLLGLLTRGLVSDGLDKMYTVEIYRPKVYTKDEPVLFYEMGEWYPVTQPGTVSRDYSKRDWRFSSVTDVTAADVVGTTIFDKLPIMYGDVHVVQKNFYFNWVVNLNGPRHESGSMPFPQMNENKDNAGGVWNHNNGRPLLAYQYAPQNLYKYTQLRFGGKFLEDSIFTAINTFRDENQFIYPGEYGPIRALVNTSNTQVDSVGNILLAIGEDQAWSIYVNRVTIDDLSGRTQVGLSDKVLGSYNTLLGGHGTLNGESVSKNNSRVIWWNAKKGTWVRYSRDGLTPISQIYNMKNWFNDLAALIINEYGTSENPKAISVQDNYHETWLTAINHSNLPSTFKGYASYKCAEFHESQDEWKSIFDYMPDVFARLDNEVYSIIGCKVHIHEQGEDYGSFYGVKKDSYWQPISNMGQRQNKVWQYVNLQATDKWSFPSIQGDFKSNGATMQETELLLENLTEREGLFVSELLRDENSVNKTNAIVTGNSMRGRALTLMLKLDPSVTWLSVLNYLIVGFTPSEKNVKK